MSINLSASKLHFYSMNGVGNQSALSQKNNLISSNQSITSDTNLFYQNNYSKNYIGYIPMFDIENPEKLVLSYPLNNSTLIDTRIIFRWNDCADTWSGIQFYKLQLSKYAGFTTLYTDTQTTDTYLSIAINTYYETYYWRVISYDNFYNYDTSEIR